MGKKIHQKKISDFKLKSPAISYSFTLPTSKMQPKFEKMGNEFKSNINAEYSSSHFHKLFSNLHKNRQTTSTLLKNYIKNGILIRKKDSNKSNSYLYSLSDSAKIYFASKFTNEIYDDIPIFFTNFLNLYHEILKSEALFVHSTLFQIHLNQLYPIPDLSKFMLKLQTNLVKLGWKFYEKENKHLKLEIEKDHGKMTLIISNQSCLQIKISQLSKRGKSGLWLKDRIPTFSECNLYLEEGVNLFNKYLNPTGYSVKFSDFIVVQFAPTIFKDLIEQKGEQQTLPYSKQSSDYWNYHLTKDFLLEKYKIVRKGKVMEQKACHISGEQAQQIYDHVKVGQKPSGSKSDIVSNYSKFSKDKAFSDNLPIIANGINKISDNISNSSNIFKQDFSTFSQITKENLIRQSESSVKISENMENITNNIDNVTYSQNENMVLITQLIENMEIQSKQTDKIITIQRKNEETHANFQTIQNDEKKIIDAKNEMFNKQIKLTELKAENDNKKLDKQIKLAKLDTYNNLLKITKGKKNKNEIKEKILILIKDLNNSN